MQSFVSRTFLLGSDEVVCSFAKPLPDGKDFRCDYRIVFPTRERCASGFGVDEVQALMLAMQRAHLDLLTAPEREEDDLLWLGMKDLGLPLSANVKADDFSPGR